MRPVTPEGFATCCPARPPSARRVARRLAEVFVGVGLRPGRDARRRGPSRARGGGRLARGHGVSPHRPRRAAARSASRHDRADRAPRRVAARRTRPARTGSATPPRSSASTSRCAARPRQFTQAGVELVGAAGPAADAEVLARARRGARRERACATSPWPSGTVAVLRRWSSAAGAPAPWGEAVLAAAHDRNLVGLDALARDGPRSSGRGALRRSRASAAAAKPSPRAAPHAGPAAALPRSTSSSATWDLLEAAGVADRVVVDFGVMRSFDYYTGLVVEAYAPGWATAWRRRPLRRRARGLRRARAGRRASRSASSG